PSLTGQFCTMSTMKPSLQPMCTDAQFKEYISKIVGRYRGKVVYFELGNEPNLNPRFKDDPQQYAKALDLAYSALKLANPTAKLVIGGLTLSEGADVDYAQELSNFGAPSNFDVMNWHTYDSKTIVGYLFSKIRAEMPNKPIWITEMGYPSIGGKTGFPY